MEKKILKQLKTEYESLEIKPSANLWDQIEGALEKEMQQFYGEEKLLMEDVGNLHQLLLVDI